MIFTDIELDCLVRRGSMCGSLYCHGKDDRKECEEVCREHYFYVQHL